jgi:hypothetical protein
MKSYYIFDSKVNLESNSTARVSNPRKRRRSGHSEISVGPDTKRGRAEGKFLECLHLRISLLEDLFNNASYQAGRDPQRTPETLGIGERVAGLEKINYINHDFRTNLRDSLGNFYCPAEECDRSYKTAADLHVHIRGKPGNGHNILKRIIDRTYCIPCELQCSRPRDLQHHEKASHGEAYDSRIELFLGFLTQDAPQESLVHQTRIGARDNGPAQDLNALSDQAFQPKRSYTESSNVLANSTGFQPFNNNHQNQTSDISFTSALTLRENEDIQSYFSSNNGTTPDSNFPFQLAPIQQLNTSIVMRDTLDSIQASNPSTRDLSFPFDLAPCSQQNIGIGDAHIQDSQMNNSFAHHPNFPSPTGFLRQKNVGFERDSNIVDGFGGHQNFFPFNITPSQQQNIDFISGQSSVALDKVHI